MRKSGLLLLLILTASTGFAEVTLPKILSSHMVLQRGQPIHLWGWADPGEQVTATLRNSTASTKTDELGKWSLYLPAEFAGGPYQVVISGSNRIVLDDVMVGDVWFASGQSNMEMPLQGFATYPLQNGAQEIRNANRPNLRLLHIPHKAVPYPQQDQAASWTLCTPESAASFSAVAYFFAREIADREHVTVGVIDSSFGGTPAEAWISMDSLGARADLAPVFEEWGRFSDGYADLQRTMAREKREDAAARAANRPAPWHPWHPVYDSWDPSWLYNGMVAPAIGYPIKGVVWYQGASNSGLDRAWMYNRVFPALIADWRERWAEGNLPFLFVQISTFDAGTTQDWPTIREAQRQALSVANTAMAVTLDIGVAKKIHPPDKQDVGHRLALAAQALAYGEPVEYSGPLFRQAVVEGGEMHVLFSHAESGLAARGGSLTGFEVAGEDHVFVPAGARIVGQTVVVSSPKVQGPVYVRYGWANAPAVNLYNQAGLPASPFTSEKMPPRP